MDSPDRVHLIMARNEYENVVASITKLADFVMGCGGGGPPKDICDSAASVHIWFRDLAPWKLRDSRIF
jgi:hypothetical protein